MTPAASSNVRRIYRELYHIARQQAQQHTKNGDMPPLKELRNGFRRPIAEGESVEKRLAEAESRLSFLRITTTKLKPRGESGVWVYQNGQRVAGATATSRGDGKGVVSNWDGKNLDPQAVTTHRKQLRRAGFVNNAHAKGFF